jgi:hypothetical protein
MRFFTHYLQGNSSEKSDMNEWVEKKKQQGKLPPSFQLNSELLASHAKNKVSVDHMGNFQFAPNPAFNNMVTPFPSSATNMYRHGTIVFSGLLLQVHAAQLHQAGHRGFPVALAGIGGYDHRLRILSCTVPTAN